MSIRLAIYCSPSVIPVTFDYDIKLEGLCIQRITSTKFLGVIIDQNLKWTDHIGQIQSKIAKGMGILARARRVFASSTLLTLFYSFIFHYLTYCIEAGGELMNVY